MVPSVQRREAEKQNTTQPYQEKDDDIIGGLLFGNNIEQTKETIQKFWKLRETKMKKTVTRTSDKACNKIR